MPNVKALQDLDKMFGKKFEQHRRTIHEVLRTSGQDARAQQFLRELEATPADVNAVDKNGETAMHAAADEQRLAASREKLPTVARIARSAVSERKTQAVPNCAQFVHNTLVDAGIARGPKMQSSTFDPESIKWLVEQKITAENWKEFGAGGQNHIAPGMVLMFEDHRGTPPHHEAIVVAHEGEVVTVVENNFGSTMNERQLATRRDINLRAHFASVNAPDPARRASSRLDVCLPVMPKPLAAAAGSGAAASSSSSAATAAASSSNSAAAAAAAATLAPPAAAVVKRQ